MLFKRLGQLAVVMVACVLGSAAAAQAPATLQVRNAAGALVNVAGQADATGALHYRDVTEGLDGGGNPRAWSVDATGLGHVSVDNTVGVSDSQEHADLLALQNALAQPLLPAGAATGANQQSILTALGSLNATLLAGIPLSGKQESFTLVSANTPSAAATVYGGQYVFNQICTAYGTIALQLRGPDGATWENLGSYTTADASGGHTFTLAGQAVVEATVIGAGGCNATLSRVP